MRARLRYRWDLLRESYWFLPSVMALASIALAFASVSANTRISGEVIERLGWVYTGGPEGARAVLSTVAGSMVTVAGVVFSITIVALQLASSQFGPRVLGSFMRDRGNQLVLGTFIATFLYCLLVLRTVRTPGSDGADAVVPHLSVTIGLALGLASLGVLIYFIHHVSISIQAPNLIHAIAGELHESVRALFPEEIGEGEGAPAAPPRHLLPDGFEAGARAIEAPRNGYLEAVDLDALLRQAVEHDLVVRLEYRPGDFVMLGSVLAMAWPADRVDGERLDALRGLFVVGTRRTTIQDAEFSMNQLVEVAVRALSPGINDPFTAINCIDQLGAALCHLARRRLPSAYRADEAGALRVAVHRPLTFDRLVADSFDQIRQNAAQHTVVYLRLLSTLTRALGCARTADQVAALERQAALVGEAAAAGVAQEADRARVRDALARLGEVAARRRLPCGPPGNA